jgi:hypothetical protein
MTRLRLFSQLALFVVLLIVAVVSCVENCERNVSADETAGMVQSIPYGGKL